MAKKAKKPPTAYLRLRAYPDKSKVSLWLVVQDGTAHAGLMWGEMQPEVAEAVSGMFGLPIRREECPVDVPPLTPPECVPIVQQGNLFEE